MKVLVTGAGGFLGRHVTAVLLEAGHEVRALVRRSEVPEGVEPWSLDLEAAIHDPELLRDEALWRGVEAVLHLAGLVSRDKRDTAAMYRIHLEATRVLLEAAQQRVQRLVLASTSGTVAVSQEDVGPMDETHQPDFELVGRWPYYLSKHHQEQMVLRWGADGHGEVIILNPSLLLGPGDHKGSSTQDVLDVLNERHPAAVPGTVAFVDARDVAPIFERALRAGSSGHRYLLNGANLATRGFVERIAQLGGVRPPRVVLPGRWAHEGARWLSGLGYALDMDLGPDPVDVDMARHHWACDSTRAQRTFDFRTRDPMTTLRDTIEDLKARRLFRAS
ncbi:MAG: NAD-dependent epimerase/dehydratase family protein [Myxococcota bacterium]